MRVTPYLQALRSANFIPSSGAVIRSQGLLIESIGPDAALGEMCLIKSSTQSESIACEVVGLRDNKLLLMPYADLRGIRIGSSVVATGQQVSVPVGQALLGRVIDAFGVPLDNMGVIIPEAQYPLYQESPEPLARVSIQKVMETGVRAIDALLTIGRGQRIGIFSGSGVGKSTLLGMCTEHAQADINVIALIGERGREVQDFIKSHLQGESKNRTVIVVATSDQPALLRTRAALAATSIAEYFRDQGKHVLLVMDSVTRYAMAMREVGLAMGEPPTARGYTPSVFANLPKLVERCGNVKHGSITALYTVLVEGDDLNDPIADTMRALLDGHIVLSRELANQGHYPPIDLLASNSRLLPNLLTVKERELVKSIVSLLSFCERNKQMVELGVYRPGNNPELDRALAKLPDLNQFLMQGTEKVESRHSALIQLAEILSKA